MSKSQGTFEGEKTMSKSQGTKIYQMLGLSENEAARYAELIIRLDRMDQEENVTPLTEEEKKFIDCIRLKLKSK